MYPERSFFRDARSIEQDEAAGRQGGGSLDQLAAENYLSSFFKRSLEEYIPDTKVQYRTIILGA